MGNRTYFVSVFFHLEVTKDVRIPHNFTHYVRMMYVCFIVELSINVAKKPGN